VSEIPGTDTPLCIGDRVALRGTRIVGNVKHVANADDRVVLKVTDVIDVRPTSKKARAWLGAWVTCPPAMVEPLLPTCKLTTTKPGHSLGLLRTLADQASA
jgi:hypothetical protein